MQIDDIVLGLSVLMFSVLIIMQVRGYYEDDDSDKPYGGRGLPA